MSADIAHLHSVPPTQDDLRLPDFDGNPVDATRIKLTSVTSLEAGDIANHIDETVRLYVEGQVVRVDHIVDARGRIVRQHVVKVVDAIQLPWSFDVTQFED